MSRIHLSLFLLLFFVFSVYPSDTASVEMLIRGVNQARLSIQNGELQYFFRYNYISQNKSEEEVASWMQREKEKELKEFIPDPFYPDVGLKEFEEQYLIPHLNYQAIQERQRTDFEKASVAFQILDAGGTGFPKLYQYKMTLDENPGITVESPATPFPQPGTFYHLSYDTQLQVKEDIGNIVFSMPSVRTWGSDYYGGFFHYWAWGRSTSRVPNSAKYIGKELMDGVECDVLGFENEAGRHAKIWIDTAKAFCIRRVESRENSEAPVSVLSEFKSFQRFEDIWYPTFIQYTLYDEKGSVQNSYNFRVFSAEFNVSLPKDFFKIDGDFYFRQNPRTHDADIPGFDSLEVPLPNDRDDLLLLCGPQSLLRICELLKVKTDLRELKKLSNFHPNRGTTMIGLKEAATYKGLAPTGVRASVPLLKKKKLPLPAIAYVEGNHFLVFETVNTNGVDISDPAQKYTPHLTWRKLSEIWNGELLIFEKKKAHTQKHVLVPLAFTETPEHDFGKALGGSKIYHTFTLENIGQKPLKILSVTETCACTASDLSQDEIHPGSTGSISAVLTVPSGNTPVEENLHILTNDPTQRVLTLTLKGKAFIPLTTFPERLAFGNQKPLQKPLVKRISLHVQDDVQIQEVQTTSEYLKAKLETEGEIPHVEVLMLPSMPIGRFSHNLLIDYEYQGQQTTHDVLIFGEISGELQVIPKRLFFGLIKEPSAVSKTITISSRHALPFQITSIEPGSKAIVIDIAKHENNSRYHLTATISPKAEKGEFSGEIVIHTANVVQLTLRIPFFGILADASTEKETQQ